MKRLGDLLAGYHESLLRDIARAHGLSVEGGREALAARILKRVSGPDFPRASLERLTPRQKVALRLIAAAGPAGVVVEQCHQRLNQLEAGGRRRVAGPILSSLIGQGLVCVDRVNYREVYLVPAEVQAPLSSLLERELLAEVGATGVEPGGGDGRAMLRYLHHFLALAWKRQLELTREGRLRQKVRLDFAGLVRRANLAWPEEQEPLAFIESFCRRSGLTAPEGGRLVPTAALEQWVNRPEGVKRWEVFRFWQEDRAGRDADFAAVLGVLQAVPPGTWVDEGQLLRHANLLSLAPVEDRLARHFRGHLLALGVLERGKRGPQPALRLTPWGREALAGRMVEEEAAAEEGFYVQSDFEVLLPAAAGLDCLWRLEQLADLVAADQVMVYRLSRTSFYRAMKLGVDAVGALAFLRGQARAGLPQNVDYSLCDWSRSFGRVGFAEALLLRCDDERLADEILASPRLGPHVLARLNPCDLAVDPERRSELAQLLEEEGYMPRPGVSRVDREPAGPTDRLPHPRRPG